VTSATLYADAVTARQSSVITVAYRLHDEAKRRGVDVHMRGIVERKGPIRRTDVGWFHGYPHQLAAAHLRAGIHRRFIAGLQLDAEPAPESWRATLAKLREVYTPATWCAERLRHVVHPDCAILIVPHGIDPPVSTHRQTLRERFTALFVTAHDQGGRRAWEHHMRKGLDVAVQACACADVDLIVRGGDVAEQWCAQHAPDVYVCNEWLHTGQMDDLMRSVHVVLVPSRAEAFGLVACEALARGVPVVATGGTGMDDYLPDDARAEIIPTSGATVPLATFGITHGNVLDVGMPGAAAALDRMRYHYADRRALAESMAGEWIAAHAWPRAADPLISWLLARS
jgi:glycosyltransferase involved in cell wall biosynthesis